MYRQTPLSPAAQNGHDTVVKLLLQAGADIESKDIDGHTPLSMAAYNGHDAIVKLLKSHHPSHLSHPSSPFSRYEPLDAHIKTAATPLRMEHTNTMYIVDNGFAKMIAEMGTAPRSREYRKPLLKERSNYHSSGLSSLPRDVDEGMLSYMDAAVIYRNTASPRMRGSRQQTAFQCH
jgi:ankyrin repeat protein